MTEKLLLDTNVIIHFPSALQNLKNVHVHLRTVEELDYLKESENGELAYRARKGAKLIEQNLDKITIEKDDYKQKKVDDTLLMCAKKKKLILVTNDLTLKLKCTFNFVDSISYTNGDKTIVTGVKKIALAEESLSEYIKHHDNFKDLYENEFLIFQNDKSIVHTDGSMDHESFAQFIKKGNDLEKVKDHIINSKFNNKVTARNVEQKCLIHALFDQDIKIISVSGSFGTGKLKCSLAM